jgi:nucleotide-binding universal stress UspA family protein
MKNILIALDYDPTAKKIAETGDVLAKSMNAQVILLHVIYDASYYSSLDYSPIMGFSGFNAISLDNATEDLKTHAEHFLYKSKKHLADESIKTVVTEGDTADAILKTAKEINADVIVMGSHSRRWLDKILMGSITEEVLNRTLIPLLIIPTGRK